MFDMKTLMAIKHRLLTALWCVVAPWIAHAAAPQAPNLKPVKEPINIALPGTGRSSKVPAYINSDTLQLDWIAVSFPTTPGGVATPVANYEYRITPLDLQWQSVGGIPAASVPFTPQFPKNPGVTIGGLGPDGRYLIEVNAVATVQRKGKQRTIRGEPGKVYVRTLTHSLLPPQIREPHEVKVVKAGGVSLPTYKILEMQNPIPNKTLSVQMEQREVWAGDRCDGGQIGDVIVDGPDLNAKAVDVSKSSGFGSHGFLEWPEPGRKRRFQWRARGFYLNFEGTLPVSDWSEWATIVLETPNTSPDDRELGKLRSSIVKGSDGIYVAQVDPSTGLASIQFSWNTRSSALCYEMKLLRIDQKTGEQLAIPACSPGEIELTCHFFPTDGYTVFPTDPGDVGKPTASRNVDLPRGRYKAQVRAQSGSGIDLLTKELSFTIE